MSTVSSQVVQPFAKAGSDLMLCGAKHLKSILYPQLPGVCKRTAIAYKAKNWPEPRNFGGVGEKTVSPTSGNYHTSCQLRPRMKPATRRGRLLIELLKNRTLQIL